MKNLIFALFMGTAQAGLLDDAKSVVSDTADTAGGIISGTVDATSKMVGDTVDSVTGAKTPEQMRQEIDQAEAQAIQKLLSQYPQAKEELAKAAGYAVFDSRKFSFLMTSESGVGVVVAKDGNRTYMKMLGIGANIGMGMKYMQLVFIFPTEKLMNEFINSGWDINTEVEAQGGEDRIGESLHLANGVIIYDLSKAGLTLSATLSGVKYWKDDKLNHE